MYRTKVEIVDAVTAAELIGTTMSNNSDVGCPFPTNPIETYHSKGIYIVYNLLNFMRMYKIFYYNFVTNVLIFS